MSFPYDTPTTDAIAAAKHAVRERAKLSYVGVVSVALVVNRNGEMVGDPDVVFAGVPKRGKFGEDMAELIDETGLEMIEAARRLRARALRLGGQVAAGNALDMVLHIEPLAGPRPVNTRHDDLGVCGEVGRDAGAGAARAARRRAVEHVRVPALPAAAAPPAR